MLWMEGFSRLRISNDRPCDRFIPYRPNLDVDGANYKIRTCVPVTDEVEAAQYKDSRPTLMSKLLNGGKLPSEGRILPLTVSSGKSTIESVFNPHMLYSKNEERRNIRRHAIPKSPDSVMDMPELRDDFYKNEEKRNIRRHAIPKSPDSVMDMPELRDDFYTNLLDWGTNNMIAVALHQSTYVWDTVSKACQMIKIYSPEVNERNDYFITSLRWKRKDNLLAIGDTEGDITVFHVEGLKMCRLLTKTGRKCPVGSLLWVDHRIISGNRKGIISIIDQRAIERSGMVVLTGHRQREVCGLAYNGSYLASGGDGGLVNIWDLRMNKTCCSITAHTACAKALAWCPWRREVIASGGGSSDGYIRLWNSYSGEKVGEAFTQSQVSGLHWSEEYQELVSAHGSAVPEKNDIVVWNMRRLEFDPLACLRQHVARPLHLAMSPDKTTIASAGADEALCIWKLFPKKSNKAKTKWDSSPLNLFRSIR